MTHKVIIIDDNELIRTALRKSIDWRALDCEVVCDAGDGIKGKRKCLSLKPDIIITDIKMPGIDGLEMVRMIKHDLPSAKTIVITGYHDFTFAQKAVKIGVFDFILKPIDDRELTRVVKSALSRIKIERLDWTEKQKVLEENRRLRSRLSETAPFVKGRLILDLIHGGSAGEEAAELEFDGKSYFFLAYNLKTGDSLSQRKLERDVHSSAADLNLEAIDVSTGGGSGTAAIFFRKNTAANAAAADKFIAALRKKYASHECVFIASHVRGSVKDMKEIYKKIQIRQQKSFFLASAGGGMDQALGPEDARSENSSFKIINELESLIHVVGRIDEAKLALQVDHFIDKIVQISNGDVNVAKSLILEACLHICGRPSTASLGIGHEMDVDGILGSIDSLKDIDEARSYMLSLLGKIAGIVNARSGRHKLLVDKILQYVNDNIGRNLSLGAVAKRFEISPAYLSSLIKKETGVNFIDRVTRARIAAAKRLLKETFHKVNEVGRIVGYRDYAYFYQVFKKLEGVSPSKYRNRL